MSGRPARARMRSADVGRLFVLWASSAGAMWAADALLPGLTASTPWAYLLVAAVSGVIGLLIRPVLVEVSARVGWAAVLPMAAVGQAVVMQAAIALVPAVEADFWTALAASWITSALATLLAWFATSGTDDALEATLLSHLRRSEEVPDPEVPGVVFVQLDGVPFPVLHWAVRSGAVPTIRRWLTGGDYVLREWRVQFPCTTPASQLGLLHGTVDGVPAFRWYDRSAGRVLVANRPEDARVIEERASDGHGLLWDGGASISNLFTGDAPLSFLTMSRIEVRRGSTDTRRVAAWFLISPDGFARSFSRALAEMVRERWQARRQVRRALDPRMSRGWTIALLRAVTNALLRDLNTALVAESMRRGVRSIYVDYVDYDEVAHHAGMFRPESLAVLDALDQVLGTLERLAAHAVRPYRIVVLSDHGQSQGLAFEDRYGEDLATVCQRLMRRTVQSVTAPVEGWGRAEALAGDVGSATPLAGRLVDRLDRRAASAYDEGADALAEEPVVLGSGNLGLLYLPDDRRRSLDDLAEDWPKLVPGLVAHPGVAFVAGLSREGAACAVGAEGRVDLDSGRIEGTDPLAVFGEHARRLLRRSVHLKQAPDLYVNSSLDLDTGDVAAFEDLVGAHGGLGGPQDSAVLLVPSDFQEVLPQRIEGADALHRLLVDILVRLGHRGRNRFLLMSSPSPDAP